MSTKAMELHLLRHYKDEITDLLNDENDSTHVSINADLNLLQKEEPALYKDVLTRLFEVLINWDDALLNTQKQLVEDGWAFLESDYQIKENCHVRFTNIPSTDNILKGVFPSVEHTGQFVQIKGSIIRMSQERLLEYKREYICSRCKETIVCEAEYDHMYIFNAPTFCKKLNMNGLSCRGNMQPKNSFPLPIFCKDFQEIRVQEMFSNKRVPLSLIVCLENDLVDTCVPGECVSICGKIVIRRRPLIRSKRSEIELTMRAVSISKDENEMNFNKDYSEKMFCIKEEWKQDCNKIGQLNARDLIIKSICSDVCGMYPVKLAIALSLCSKREFDQCAEMNSRTKRGNSHLLMIGDPGVAKSNLLKFASKISIKSVHTTGVGCSTAGLTAAAVREDGEYHLEAGALVLADGGVCCIDEFNLMKEHEKGSIHEAMEQQTISIAKAGIVAKLNSRCVIIAAANPRCLNKMNEPDGININNIGISSPLLSRFDLIIALSDQKNVDWDSKVADHKFDKSVESNSSEKLWNLERLQFHFLTAHEIHPILSDEATSILASYYKLCRLDSYADPGRTTVRLFDSLNRLAESHARLMVRSKVLGIDAIIIIKLIESTWGFGRLLKPMDMIKEDLPFGPTVDDVLKILKLLNLSEIENKLIEELNSLNTINTKNKISSTDENEIHIDINNFERIFGYNNHTKKNKITKNCITNNTSKSSETFVKKHIIEENQSIEISNAPATPPETSISKTVSPSHDQIELWDENDLNLTMEILEMSNTLKVSDKTNKKTAENYVNENQDVFNIKNSRKRSIENIPPVYDNLGNINADDDDLELDLNINSNKIAKILKNEKITSNNTSSLANCSYKGTEGAKISKKTMEKLNNFKNPNLVNVAKNTEKSDNDSGYNDYGSQISILNMASQYENLDFLNLD